MRAASLVLVLLGCSYDWNGLTSGDGSVAADPHHVILPGFACNPVSNDGCSAGSTYCLGLVQSNQTFSRLRCRGSFGSGSRGTYCGDETFCVPGFVCWTDPADPGGTHHTCERPCFVDADCGASGHCDTTGRYAVAYDRATLYRCR